MTLLEKHLYIRKSTLPCSGNGLFTRVFIPKGTRLVEYKGKVLTWNQVEKLPDNHNGYVFYFNRRYVIDAWKTKKSIAHFANDANGIVRTPGVRNNADYETAKKRCYIKSNRDIPAGSEILVCYGGDYWSVIRHNIREDQRNKRNGKTLRPPRHLPAKRLAN